jgi:hypothetical protein
MAPKKPEAVASFVMEEVQATSTSPQTHETSLAVWDLPSRAVTGARFKIKLGAKCSAACSLKDRPIEIFDETGTRVAEARLGENPWPGTSALYWAEMDLSAPASEGVHGWTARFAVLEPNGSVAEAAPRHTAASASFSFLTLPPPDHVVTVQVLDQESRAPVAGAIVRMGPYRASTGEDGVANVEMVKGQFDLTVYKADYEAFARAIEVKEDVAVGVELRFAPQREDAYWG